MVFREQSKSSGKISALPKCEVLFAVSDKINPEVFTDLSHAKAQRRKERKLSDHFLALRLSVLA
jgi:hypothetical protein